MRNRIVQTFGMVGVAIGVMPLGGCGDDDADVSSSAEVTAVSDDADGAGGTLALDAEIEELVADYFATANAFDRDGFAELITDDFMMYATYELDPSSAPERETTAAEYLGALEGWLPLYEFQYERLGEAFMMGNSDGPWHIAQAFHMNMVVDGYPSADESVSILTIVDDDGTLKVARDLQTPHRVQSTD